MAETLSRVHADAVMFAVTIPVGRDSLRMPPSGSGVPLREVTTRRLHDARSPADMRGSAVAESACRACTRTG